MKPRVLASFRDQFQAVFQLSKPFCVICAYCGVLESRLNGLLKPSRESIGVENSVPLTNSAIRRQSIMVTKCAPNAAISTVLCRRHEKFAVSPELKKKKSFILNETGQLFKKYIVMFVIKLLCNCVIFFEIENSVNSVMVFPLDKSKTNQYCDSPIV